MLTSLTERWSRLAAATRMLRPLTLSQLSKSHQDLQRQVEALEEQVRQLKAAALSEQQFG